MKQINTASPVLSNDTAANILRRSIARVELDKETSANENLVRGKEEKDKRVNKQDFGNAVKELMEEMLFLRKTVHTEVAVVKYGGYSRAALRYTIRKIDDLVGDLQACKEYLKELE